MTIDHLTWMLFPGYPTDWWVLALHLVGRITAPIMWYFIAEGYHYTRDVKKYALRLLAFAVVSHFAYNFCSGISFIPFKDSVFNQTSVIWSLFWGLMAICLWNSKLKDWIKTVLLVLILAVSFCADWSCIAVLAILHISNNRGDFKRQMVGMVVFTAMYAIIYALFIDPVYGILQMGVMLSIPILKCYNGQRGEWKGMKWFFYLYYPLHLVVIGILRLVLK